MGWSAADIPDQSGKVAVITGASSGLGLEAARALSRKGATVVIAVRDLDKGQRVLDGLGFEMPNADLELRDLDLGSLESVRAFCDAILEQHQHVDVLLNNAGIMATPPRQTQDGFELQVGINHLGHFALTAGLMPALARAGAARVVTITSVARRLGRPLTARATSVGDDYDPWRAYADSKLANYHFGIELARRLANVASPISSLVAHPGLSNTNLQVATVESAGAGLQGRLWRILSGTLGMPPAKGVLPALRAATDPRARNGQFYGPRWTFFGAPVQAAIGASSVSPAATAGMWHVSASLSGADFGLGDDD